jgi:hypothetical protein
VEIIKVLIDFSMNFFRFLVFFLLTQFGAEADQLVEFLYDDFFYRNGCVVSNVDLSKKTLSDKFTFTGTQEQKRNRTWIRFDEIGRVAHVPQNLVEEFSNLNDLRIYSSEIPIVKNNLLGPQFSWIEELRLRTNKIRIIEEGAFQRLHNLKWICLYGNEIKSLNMGIFQNNPKLEIISLWANKIKIIAPETFQNLNQLEFVDLERNDCVDKEFGCLNCGTKIDHTELNRDLNACYENYKKSSDLLNKGEKIFK